MKRHPALVPLSHDHHHVLVIAQQLRRATTELGMVGGVLPVPGLARPYGDSAFDVLYEEAQSLGTMLAVHGASYRDIGIDFPQSSHGGVGRRGFGYAHPAQPLTQMVQFINMVCEEVFERFPRLKVAFLEAGCGWVPYWVERIDRRAGRPFAADQVRNHPVYFQAELEEPESLRHFVSLFGEDRLIYASDYPHLHATDPDADLLPDLPVTLAQKIRSDNARAFYRI
jgi:predicted TIM-barrel fold metal-dependent hydrolase